jgi:hypothetical protein
MAATPPAGWDPDWEQDEWKKSPAHGERMGSAATHGDDDWDKDVRVPRRTHINSTVWTAQRSNTRQGAPAA